jgi:hypothetical protein
VKRARSVALAVLVALLLGCDGSFRFDQRSDDGGVDACASPTCGWQTGPCDAESCSLICQEAMTCGGSCDVSCSARCEKGSRCALTTGDSATALCQRGASCEFWLGPNGMAQCQPGSACKVRCSSGCLLHCDPSANCELQCGSAAARAIAGIVSC